MENFLTYSQFISLAIVAVVYYYLISEKIHKVVVVLVAGAFLIMAQVFAGGHFISGTSQEHAFHFIGNNLDVLGFIIGMMILVGIVRKSGFFEAIALWLVKVIKGNPYLLLVTIGYLALFMTAFLSNIPTVLILVPIILVLVKQLRLPYLPFIFIIVTMANLGGAMTPLSDPTTYYQAKTVGLTFVEVLSNSGLIVLVLSVVATLYTLLIFRKELRETKVSAEDVSLFRPLSALKDKKILKIGVPILFIAISLLVLKEFIAKTFNIYLDNASVIFFFSFLSVFLFSIEVKDVFKKIIDWEIVFFFIGLFVVIGSLEYTGIIEIISQALITVTNGNMAALTFLMTMGSGLLSVFIDNVPYNIAMVGAVQSMQASGVNVYPLWWALNLGTSLGGAGSMIGAACNVVSFGQAEQDGFHTNFVGYLVRAVPLVIINAFITFLIIWLKFLR
jgi:Na+/H+ antiporter NhaD/arsenite permease-like protein